MTLTEDDSTDTVTPPESSNVVGVCVRVDDATGEFDAEWSFAASPTAPEPANWSVSLTAGTNTFITSSRPGSDRSISFTLPMVLFSIFVGRTWSVGIDGGADTNGDPIEADQVFPTDGTWTGTAGVGQC